MFRSLLFVPATRPDRVVRALASGADAVCIDLEDAVPPHDKESARGGIADLIRGSRDKHPALGVRINSHGSPWWEDDLEIARDADFIMVPKAEANAALSEVARVAGGVALWPLIETAEGLHQAPTIAQGQGVAGLVFGAFDYSADVGCEVEWEPLLFARSLLVVAAARSGVELLDSPSARIADLAGLVCETRRARALGFTGRACIHPDQIVSVNSVYTPEAAHVAQAERVLAAFDDARGGAAQLDGKMIDLPVALAARRVLARARTVRSDVSGKKETVS